MNLWVSEDLGESIILRGDLEMLDARETSLEPNRDDAQVRDSGRRARGVGVSPSRSRDCLGAYLAAISKVKIAAESLVRVIDAPPADRGPRPENTGGPISFPPMADSGDRFHTNRADLVLRCPRHGIPGVVGQ